MKTAYLQHNDDNVESGAWIDGWKDRLTDKGREVMVNAKLHRRIDSRVEAHINWWAYGKLVKWWVTKQVEWTGNVQCWTGRYKWRATLLLLQR